MAQVVRRLPSMLWQIDSSESFKKCISLLEERFREEIAFVLKGLREEGPYFDPGDNYFIERSGDGGYVVCHHVNSWCGWELVWENQYICESTVSKIVVYLLPPTGEAKSIVLTPKLPL